MKAPFALCLCAVSLTALLTGCAGPEPRPDPGDAWVSLSEETPDTVLANKVDGQSVRDGRYFEITPGDHKLQVMVYDEQINDEQRTCTANIDYAGFKAGHHYKVVETDLGDHLSADLQNAQGKTVASAHRFSCMPG